MPSLKRSILLQLSLSAKIDEHVATVQAGVTSFHFENLVANLPGTLRNVPDI